VLRPPPAPHATTKKERNARAREVQEPCHRPRVVRNPATRTERVDGNRPAWYTTGVDAGNGPATATRQERKP